MLLKVAVLPLNFFVHGSELLSCRTFFCSTPHCSSQQRFDFTDVGESKP